MENKCGSFQFSLLVGKKKKVNECVKENEIPDGVRIQCERTCSQQCDF